MTLIEVIVACSLLAITFTSLTAVSIKLAQRNRSNAYVEQRTATFFEQVNRVESMPYDSLTKYLTHGFGEGRRGLLRLELHGGRRVAEHERPRSATARSR